MFQTNFQKYNKIIINKMNQSLLAKFKKSPSFSFRGKFQNNTTSNNPQNLPSPNLYTPQKPLKNPIKVVFSKSSRKSFFDKPIDKSPGPGQYQTLQNKDQSYSSLNNDIKNKTFTSRFNQKIQHKPGPGAYQIKNDFKKTLPSFSIRKKTKSFHEILIKNNDFKQAPGAYDVQPKLVKSSSVISIPKSPRMKLKQNVIPGPGKYEMNENFYSQRSFGKKNFSTSPRKISFDIKNSSPGPKYIFESSFDQNMKKQRGFSCRKKLTQIIKGQYVPGPGKYQTQSQISYRSIQSCKIPKAPRNTLNIFNSTNLITPDPAKYENISQTYNSLKFKSQSAPKFSKAKLQKLSAVKLDTVDKFYDSKDNIIKKSSSSFSIGSQKRKSLFQKIQKAPGPGDYNHHQVKVVKETVLAPKFSQSQRHNPILNKLPVGPGEYYSNQFSTSLKKVGPKFSKGKRNTDISHLQNQTRTIIKLTNMSPQKYQSLIPIKR